MRIALVIYGSLTTLSGGYLYDRKLVEYLEGAGDRVEILSLPWKTYTRHLLHNYSNDLRRKLVGLQVDVLLQDELNHPSLFLVNRWLHKRVAYPIISIVHHLRSSEGHPAWLMPLYRRVEADYLRSVDGFIYNSETTRRVVEGVIGEVLPSVVARPAGDRLRPEIGEEEIAARARLPGALKLLFVGNLIPRKGLHTLLEALSALSKDLWQLTVAGSLEMEPAYAHQMQAQVTAASLSRQVVFSGPLDESELAEAMRAHQILVVPSSYEGFGIAYLEGMGFGLPAIATTAGGAGEIVTSGEDGYLVAPDNPAELAGLISQLAGDRDLLTRLSLAARRRYLAHPTWEETGETIRQFLLDRCR